MRTRLALGVASVLLAAVPAAAQELCLDYARGKKLGRMDSKKIDEASGMVVSLTQPGVFWVHNDSGDSERVFAISDDGDYYGQWKLRGADAVDWEDIAFGPCDDGWWDCLYLADTGNNGLDRDDLAIYRVREPWVDTDRKKPYDAKTDERAQRFPFRYPPGVEPADVEAIFVGDDGTVYLFSKSHQGVRLFRLGPLVVEDMPLVAEEIGAREDIGFITAADIAPDSGRFVVRGPRHAWEFPIAPWEDIAEAFMGSPIELKLRRERQGEAITYTLDGGALLSTSEGVEQPIYRYRCAEWRDGEGKADSAGVVAGATADDAGCAGGPEAPVSLLGVVALLLWLRRWRARSWRARG